MLVRMYVWMYVWMYAVGWDDGRIPLTSSSSRSVNRHSMTIQRAQPCRWVTDRLSQLNSTSRMSHSTITHPGLSAFYLLSRRYRLPVTVHVPVSPVSHPIPHPIPSHHTTVYPIPLATARHLWLLSDPSSDSRPRSSRALPPPTPHASLMLVFAR